MRRPALVLALALAGCDPAAAPPDAAAPAASSAAPPPAPPPPAPPPADDLDVAALQKLTKCGGGGSGACGVLGKLSTCAPWSASVPSGDGRWIGRVTVIDGGKAKDGIALLRARRVPTGDVGPGQLPVKISIVELGKEEGSAFDQAERAIRAFERQDVPPRSNATLEYVKKRTDWPEVGAMKTAGGQVYALTPKGAFLCEGPKKQIFLVQRTGASSSPDGLYAELWATTW